MPVLKEDKKIAEMTVGELKSLIRDTLLEVLDPDYGLEVRQEFENKLKQSLKSKESGEGVPLEDLKSQLGL